MRTMITAALCVGTLAACSHHDGDRNPAATSGSPTPRRRPQRCRTTIATSCATTRTARDADRLGCDEMHIGHESLWRSP
jgi:hypothetical protein